MFHSDFVLQKGYWIEDFDSVLVLESGFAPMRRTIRLSVEVVFAVFHSPRTDFRLAVDLAELKDSHSAVVLSTHQTCYYSAAAGILSPESPVILPLG